MRYVTLFFGSFNPVHKGHIALAESVLDRGLTEEVWFVLSPLNPFKPNYDFWPEEVRSERLINALDKWNAARGDRPGKMVFRDDELRLPKPSYTIQTLRHLWKTCPNYGFFILMGEDNLAELHKWKDYREVVERVERFFVYPRTNTRAEEAASNGGRPPVYPIQKEFPQKFEYIERPPLDISSTQIRAITAEGGDVSDLVP